MKLKQMQQGHTDGLWHTGLWPSQMLERQGWVLPRTFNRHAAPPADRRLPPKLGEMPSPGVHRFWLSSSTVAEYCRDFDGGPS